MRLNSKLYAPPLKKKCPREKILGPKWLYSPVLGTFTPDGSKIIELSLYYKSVNFAQTCNDNTHVIHEWIHFNFYNKFIAAGTG